MNCSVCGSPLLFDRVVFHCECGAYVHAYCADKHIVESHRPEMEEGFADLNGDFHLKYQPVAESVGGSEPIAAGVAQGRDEDEEEDLVPGEGIADDLGNELDDDTSDDPSDEVSDEDK